MGRKLASIRKVRAIEPIENADRIELAHVDGWQVVVQKGIYKEGDKCIYFEIDSVLPVAEWSSFMERRKYRVRTIKLKGALSQGLCITLEEAGLSPMLEEGTDVTKKLGVKKAGEAVHTKVQKVKLKWYQRLFPRRKKNFPSFLPKTDAERVQNIPRSQRTGLYDYTEKLDGCSATYCYRPFRPFIVASRNIWLSKDDGGTWWSRAKQYGLKKKMRKYRHGIAIQGEIVGPGIQKNPYKLKDRRLYIFGALMKKKRKGQWVRLPFKEVQEVATALDVPCVPHLGVCEGGIDWVSWVDGMKSTVNPDVLAEGIVAVSRDQASSFKAINNEFLLKRGD